MKKILVVLLVALLGCGKGKSLLENKRIARLNSDIIYNQSLCIMYFDCAISCYQMGSWWRQRADSLAKIGYRHQFIADSLDEETWKPKMRNHEK